MSYKKGFEYTEGFEHEFCTSGITSITDVIDGFEHDGYVEETYKHYVVTGSHGHIRHDSKNPQRYTIPPNVILVLYTSFTKRSCTNNNSIKHNICTSINKSPQIRKSVNMVAQDILFEGDKIPHLYALKTPDRREPVEIHECIDSDSQNYHKYNDNEVSLKTIINDISNSKQSNDIIIVHWTLCLTVQFIGMQPPSEYNERTLGVVRKSPTIFIKNIKIKKNTIHVINTQILGILINLYITFPDKYSDDYIDIIISFHKNISEFFKILNLEYDISKHSIPTLTRELQEIIYKYIHIKNTRQEISITINANNIIREINRLISKECLESTESQESTKIEDIKFMKYLIIITLLNVRKTLLDIIETQELQKSIGTSVKGEVGKKKSKKRKRTKIRKDKQKNIKNRETKKDKQQDIKNIETKIRKHKKNIKIRQINKK